MAGKTMERLDLKVHNRMHVLQRKLIFGVDKD